MRKLFQLSILLLLNSTFIFGWSQAGQCELSKFNWNDFRQPFKQPFLLNDGTATSTGIKRYVEIRVELPRIFIESNNEIPLEIKGTSIRGHSRAIVSLRINGHAFGVYAFGSDTTLRIKSTHLNAGENNLYFSVSSMGIDSFWRASFEINEIRFTTAPTIANVPIQNKISKSEPVPVSKGPDKSIKDPKHTVVKIPEPDTLDNDPLVATNQSLSLKTYHWDDFRTPFTEPLILQDATWSQKIQTAEVIVQLPKEFVEASEKIPLSIKGLTVKGQAVASLRVNKLFSGIYVFGSSDTVMIKSKHLKVGENRFFFKVSSFNQRRFTGTYSIEEIRFPNIPATASSAFQKKQSVPDMVPKNVEQSMNDTLTTFHWHDFRLPFTQPFILQESFWTFPTYNVEIIVELPEGFIAASKEIPLSIRGSSVRNRSVASVRINKHFLGIHAFGSDKTVMINSKHLKAGENRFFFKISSHTPKHETGTFSVKEIRFANIPAIASSTPPKQQHIPDLVSETTDQPEKDTKPLPNILANDSSSPQNQLPEPKPVLALKRSDKQLKDTKPPEIKIIDPDILGKESIVATNRSITFYGKAIDPSGIVYVTLNGKDAMLDDKGNFSIETFLAVGQNHFTFEAMDTLGNKGLLQVKVNRPQSARVIHQTQPAIKPGTQKWAVVVGVSKYQDSRIPQLRYAATDAKAFSDWLVSSSGGRFPPANIKLLVNEDATGDNIKEALFVWLRQAIKEDTVIIYFACHGSPEQPGSNKNLFLLPYDARYENIVTTGFPMWDIETALSRFIQSKKIVVIADTCHAEGIGKQFDIARRSQRDLGGNTINIKIQQLAQINDGICVISASGENQFSMEGEDWGGGHGVFTYYLLSGLKGEADYNHDQIVSMGELIPFLSEHVRRATQSTQTPIVSGKFDPAMYIHY